MVDWVTDIMRLQGSPEELVYFKLRRHSNPSSSDFKLVHIFVATSESHITLSAGTRSAEEPQKVPEHNQLSQVSEINCSKTPHMHSPLFVTSLLPDCSWASSLTLPGSCNLSSYRFSLAPRLMLHEMLQRLGSHCCASKVGASSCSGDGAAGMLLHTSCDHAHVRGLARHKSAIPPFSQQHASKLCLNFVEVSQQHVGYAGKSKHNL